MLPGATKSNQMSWMTREDPVQTPGVSPWTALSSKGCTTDWERHGKPVGCDFDSPYVYISDLLLKMGL